MHDKVYGSYVTRTAPTERGLSFMRQRLSTFHHPPKVSVLLALSDPDEIWIKASVASVLDGIYPHVELCVCDNASTRPHVGETLKDLAASDARVKVRRLGLGRPGGLAKALNAALSLATGRFVTLLGEGDKLTPDAPFRVVELLQDVEADVIYADEDRMDVAEQRSDPTFKPYWAPDLLLSTMYVGRPWVIRSRLVTSLGGFREDFDEGAEHDLMLRVTEKTNRVYHLPGVAYHRRFYERQPMPAGQGPQEATLRAVKETLGRRAVEAAVESGPDPYSVRVIRSLSGQPTVSVVALATGAASVERAQELARSANYPVHEVIPIEVGEGTASEPVDATPAKAANLGAAKTTGEYLLFLRDYDGATSSGWLVELLRQAQRTEAGAVGGRVIDGDGNARYAGSYFQDLGMLAGSSADAFPWDRQALYLPVLDHPFNPHAVSADCMMVRRSVFEDVGGFDDRLPTVFYDLDFSFRLKERDLTNVYTPEAGVVSRTDRPQPSAQEIQRMWERWWPMLVQTLYYRDSPLRSAEEIPSGELLSLISVSV